MRRAFLLSLAALLVAGCTRTVDIATTLKLSDVRTGWYDAGIIEGGKNKLVPSISLKLQNVTTDSVALVQLNAIFHRANEPEPWGEHFVSAVSGDGLAGGAATAPLVLRSNLGYTGEQARLQMLQNASFVDARVDIFGKQGRGGWVKLGEFPIERTLLTE